MSESGSEPSSPAADGRQPHTSAHAPSQPPPRKASELSAADEAGVEALLDFSCVLSAQLPSLAAVERDRSAFFGPTDESNWVLPGRLLVGAYPVDTCGSTAGTTAGTTGSARALQPLARLLDCGVTTFVCLQAEYDHAGRNPRVPPYMRAARRLCDAAHRAAPPGTSSRRAHADALRFLHLPITDCGVTEDAAVLRLAEALCWRLLRGEVLYVHCWGGHGRTGTVVAVVLGMLFGLRKSEALKRTQAYHDCRAFRLPVPSPQTFAQRMQVLRVLDAVQGRAPLLQTHAAAPLAPRDAGQEFELPLDCHGPDDGVEADAAEAASCAGAEENCRPQSGAAVPSAPPRACGERGQMLLWSGSAKRRKQHSRDQLPAHGLARVALRPLAAPSAVAASAETAGAAANAVAARPLQAVSLRGAIAGTRAGCGLKRSRLRMLR